MNCMPQYRDTSPQLNAPAKQVSKLMSSDSKFTNAAGSKNVSEQL